MQGTVVDEASAIETAHPRWRVWVSDTGQWWAALRAPLTPEQQHRGCLSYLRASDLEELSFLLRDHDELAHEEE